VNMDTWKAELGKLEALPRGDGLTVPELADRMGLSQRSRRLNQFINEGLSSGRLSVQWAVLKDRTGRRCMRPVYKLAQKR